MLDLRTAEPLEAHVLLLVFALRFTVADTGRQEYPAALAAHARRDVEQSQQRHGPCVQAGLLAKFTRGQLGRLDVV